MESVVFAQELQEILAALVQVLRLTKNRLDEQFADKVTPTLCPLELSKEVQDNITSVFRVCDYLRGANVLSDLGLQNQNLAADPTPRDAYFKELLTFVGLHVQSEKGTNLFKMTSMVEVCDESLIARASVEVGAYIQEVGCKAFEAHTKSYCQRTVWLILAYAPKCKLGALHMKVLQAKEVGELIPLLLPGVDLEQVAKPSLALAGTEEDKKALENEPYKILLNNFLGFAERARLTTVVVPNVSDSSGATSGIRVAEAITIIRVIVSTIDLISLAISLHILVIPKTAEPHFKDTDDLMQRFVYMLKLFQIKLQDFDQLMQAESSIVVETAGWQMDWPLSLLRIWRDALAAFVGKTQRAIILAWMHLLMECTGRCKAATPSWQVAFPNAGTEQERFDLELALRVLGIKLQPVVKTHNHGHQLLQVASGFMGGGGGANSIDLDEDDRHNR